MLIVTLCCYGCREAGDEDAVVSVVQTLEDEITRLATLKMAAKIHSFDVCRHDDDDNVVKVTRSRG